jgi:hypothetical protein
LGGLHQPGRLDRQVCRERAAELVATEVQVDTGGAIRVGEWHLPDRIGICVVLPDERAERLADVGDEGSDLDQCLDVGDPATVAIAVTSVLRREISRRMDMVEPQG